MKPISPLLLFLALFGCASGPSDDGGDQSLGECEAKPGVPLITADGAATIAAVTVEWGTCFPQWCTAAMLPGGGPAPCSQVSIDATTTCELTVVSTSGERRRVGISVTTSAAPPFRCHVGEKIYEIPASMITPTSVTLDFRAPTAP